MRLFDINRKPKSANPSPPRSDTRRSDTPESTNRRKTTVWVQ